MPAMGVRDILHLVCPYVCVYTHKCVCVPKPVCHVCALLCACACPCVCMSACVCLHACAHAYLCVCVCMPLCVHICVCICLHVPLHACVSVCPHVCLCALVFACVCAHGINITPPCGAPWERTCNACTRVWWGAGLAAGRRECGRGSLQLCTLLGMHTCTHVTQVLHTHTHRNTHPRNLTNMCKTQAHNPGITPPPPHHKPTHVETHTTQEYTTHTHTTQVSHAHTERNTNNSRITHMHTHTETHTAQASHRHQHTYRNPRHISFSLSLPHPGISHTHKPQAHNPGI